MQSLPSIRLVQENDKSLVTKINSTLVNTVPYGSSSSPRRSPCSAPPTRRPAVREASDLTNELLTPQRREPASGQQGHPHRDGARRLRHRGGAARPTKALIATINESLQIADQGRPGARAPRPTSSAWSRS
jgi:hypothetical protein